MIRAPTSSAVGPRCGHSTPGCSRASVTLKDAQGPVLTRELLMFPVSQAREPKARAMPRTPKRQDRSASDPVVVEGALVRGAGMVVPGGWRGRAVEAGRAVLLCWSSG